MGMIRMDDELFIFESLSGKLQRLLFLATSLSDSYLSKVKCKNAEELDIIQYRDNPTVYHLSNNTMQVILKSKRNTLLQWLQNVNVDTGFIAEETMTLLLEQMLKTYKKDMQLYYTLENIFHVWLVECKDIRDFTYNHELLHKMIKERCMEIPLFDTIPDCLQQQLVKGDIEYSVQSKFKLKREYQLQLLKEKKKALLEHVVKGTITSYTAIKKLLNHISENIEKVKNPIFKPSIQKDLNMFYGDEEEYQTLIEAQYHKGRFDEEVFLILSNKCGDSVLQTI